MHYGDLHAAEESKSFIVYCALWVILGIEQQLIQNSTSLILDELLFHTSCHLFKVNWLRNFDVSVRKPYFLVIFEVFLATRGPKITGFI